MTLESINYKGKLQEYCQEHKINNPVYTCGFIPKDGKTLWYPMVNYNGQDYSIDALFQTKKDAEQEIAKIVLKQHEKTKVKHTNFISKEHHLVYIDLENIQPQLFDKIPQCCYIQCFVSTFSTVDYKKYQEFVDVKIIDSGITNAVDHYLTFQAGMDITSAKTDDIFVIVSRDKSSEALVKLLTMKNFTVKHFKNSRDFEDYLESL